jgi:hypothetical protein
MSAPRKPAVTGAARIDSLDQRPLLHRILLSFQLRLTQHSSVCMLCAAPKAIGLPGCRQSEAQLITRGNPKKCYVRMVGRGSEKAGVGGSIPSLATMLSILIASPSPRFVPFRSKIQFGLAGNLTRPGMDQMDSALHQCRWLTREC